MGKRGDIDCAGGKETPALPSATEARRVAAAEASAAPVGSDVSMDELSTISDRPLVS